MKIAYFGFDLFYDCLQMLIDNGHEIMKIFTCVVDGDYDECQNLCCCKKIRYRNNLMQTQCGHAL